MTIIHLVHRLAAWFAGLGKCELCGGKMIDQWEEKGWARFECENCGNRTKY